MNLCQSKFLNTVEGLSHAWPCHRDPERSLKFRNRTMPVCARCFGIILGLPIGILMAYFGLFPSRWVGLIFIAPLLIDGCTQQMGYRISNNFIIMKFNFAVYVVYTSKVPRSGPLWATTVFFESTSH